MAQTKESKGVLDISQPQKVGYCIPLWLRDIQIEEAIKTVKGRIEPHYEDRVDSIAVVCYGPSLNDTWEEIKKFKYTITCSGAHKFLVERGIHPTWHCDVDPREHKVELMGKPTKDTEYLMASTCHPKMWEHLKGYNVKLWHIFDGTEDAKRTLPAGEWALFGGASAGLRALAIARFLGFRDLHVFGMDGSQSDKYGKHAGKHPNQPKDHQLCEYGGKVYHTTASMAECARQTPHEINQLNDVNATFYGEGLCQAIMKDYKKKPVMKGTPTVGFSKPELISPEYRELNEKLHKENLLYGVSGSKYVDAVLKFAELNKTKSILDYGCGKGLLAKGIPFPIWQYDPAIPEFSESPRPAELVVCTNVLEHIEPDKLEFVLHDLKRCVKQIGYFVIDTKLAQKTFADGRNAHLIVEGEQWWNKKLSKYFSVASIQNVKSLLHVIVAPKKENKETISSDPIVRVGEAKFYTPNATTKWRANTLLTKEPITIEWINSMKEGEILYDVGANIGGYTVWAGIKKVRVYAFEPEAENYALLVRNMVLNNIEPNAYCLAISDKMKLASLNISQSGVGGSCHTFGKPEAKILHQGCFGVTLDYLLESGLPQPDYLKIDVDGLESDVISGAKELLKNIKSLLIEINTNSQEHQNIVKHLQSIGFDYDQDQVEKSIRKEGHFKGCAEYLFKRNRQEKLRQEDCTCSIVPCVCDEISKYKKQAHSACMSISTPHRHLDSHFWTRLDKAAVVKDPTPHIFIENIFPDHVYQSILRNLPNNYQTIEEVRQVRGYKERLVSIPDSPFWIELNEDLRSGSLRQFLCSMFGIIDDNYTDETLLIRDLKGYKIGPHTDSTAKIISALFYLPSDESQLEAGTSLYTPKDKNFKCVGGPHYSFDLFNKVLTLPFKPNSLFAFLKTDTSFHGVEQYNGDKPRDVLLYDIRKN